MLTFQSGNQGDQSAGLFPKISVEHMRVPDKRGSEQRKELRLEIRSRVLDMNDDICS